MTPPPSSQAPDRIANSQTPEPPLLSSPPLTARNTGKQNGVAQKSITRPTSEQLADATNDELRAMLDAAFKQTAKLSALLGEARMSAAHYKLQHNLLTIESEEALKRMEVEHDMTKREVQVLQVNGQGREAMEYVQKLKSYCKSIEEDNVSILRRLERAKKLIVDKDDKISDLKEENHRLMERIRQNREHINVLRSPGVPLHASTPRVSPATPQQHRYTPKQTPTTGRSVRYHHGAQQENQDRFDALLQASSVLSQENNSAPSTPATGRRHDPRTPSRHHRGVFSLSSLPTTPKSVKSQAANSTLLPSAVISPRLEPRTVNSHGRVPLPAERRRKSRDSTISAEDHEETTRAVEDSYREESEIPESQASQSATSMLRSDPRESFEVVKSRTSTPNPGQKILHQAKIFGAVTKRKLDGNGLEPSKKKVRTGEGIGLGIGF